MPDVVPPTGVPAPMAKPPGSAAPNIGAAAQPQGNSGNAAQAMSLVRNALEMIQKALPMLPMGSPLHGDLLKAVSSMSKHIDQSQMNKGVDLQSLLQMVKQSSQQSPMAALNRMQPPTAAPAMPSPAAV